MTQSTSQTDTPSRFSELALPDSVMQAVLEIGYETPTPIQQKTIPPLLDGRDVLGHAPTGTGKTAAFALPILTRMDLNARGVQAIVLAPTRELAIQVAEAFSKYAKYMKNLRVLPIYGGQDYTGQIRALKRGVNVVVGTPGRVMDHMRRGTLSLDNLQTLVLDEADEMLRMGFIDDVQWILEQTPQTRQTALFSATMPPVIRRIANRHLKEPLEITIEGRLTTADTIRQRYWMVSGLHKLDALTRILEAEPFDAMLVFVRTRTATVEVAEKLAARGFSVAAMNGDMPQKQREQMVDKLKRGTIDMLVATDVVARGLDVKRISHVINYDIPYDTEAYVHRIGRTGRAGRTGDAILFVTQRERRLLGSIEKATKQKIEALQLPTVEMVNNRRIADFKQRISDTLATGELAYLQRLVEEVSREQDVPTERVGAALAKMFIGDQPLLLESKPDRSSRQRGSNDRSHRDEKSRASREQQADSHRSSGQGSGQNTAKSSDQNLHKKSRQNQHKNTHTKLQANSQAESRDYPSDEVSTTRKSPHERKSDAGKADRQDKKSVKAQPQKAERRSTHADGKNQHHEKSASSVEANRQSPTIADSIEMERFRVEVGRDHGVKPDNLVGAIANEAGLDAEFIGRIRVEAKHSTVELPAGMPKFLLKDLKRVWVCERQLNMTRTVDQTRATTDSSERNKTNKTRTDKPKKATSAKPKSRAAGKTDADATAKRDGKKKERHRDKKNKGKRRQTQTEG